MTEPQITVATAADRARVVESLVAAFAGDPVLRYMFESDAEYAAGAPLFFGRLFDKRVPHGTIWTIEHGAAVAIWEPPGTVDAEGEFTAGMPAAVAARVEAYDKALHAALPSFDHWYLGVLGTHPDHLGRRWGHAVMRAGLDRAAQDGLPSILETSTPGNVEMYRRAGWRVVGTMTEPLPVWILQQ